MLRFHRLAAATLMASFLLVNGAAFAADAPLATQESGWSLPFLGAGKGHWDTSVGVFLHKDDNSISTRNLQFRSDIDLAPGLRVHSLIRSNQSFNTLSTWSPYFDENFLEAYAFYKNNQGVFSGSLRVGKIRYLHFPYPDAIAMFDTVPTTTDLLDGTMYQTGTPSSYTGQLLTLDYADKSGLGVHASGINWSHGYHEGSNMLENYLFYRQDFGVLHFETHMGILADRNQPLGNRANGYNMYLGSISKGTTIGFLFEKLKNRPTYTGVMMTFPMDKTTKALGSIAFDWDRRPSGFAAQIPLIKGTYGGIQKQVPKDAVLVGEIKVERIRTYCSNGQARNYYEHRLSSWGETGKSDLIVVMKEEPWYLQAEAVVSPHSFAVGFKTWDQDRTGPAQLSQTATYKFYRITPAGAMLQKE